MPAHSAIAAIVVAAYPARVNSSHATSGIRPVRAAAATALPVARAPTAGELSLDARRKALERDPVVFLPTGTLEQHGPHRPVVTSSIWGKTSVAGFSAYAASKHALIGLVRTWARELGPRAITVNAVCPGWVRTEASMRSLATMADDAGRDEASLLREIVGAQAIDGLMTPADIAGTYLFLASPLAASITGQAITVDRGEILA